MGADKEQSNHRSRINQKTKNQNQPRHRCSGESPMFRRISDIQPHIWGPSHERKPLAANYYKLVAFRVVSKIIHVQKCGRSPRCVLLVGVVRGVCRRTNTEYIVPVCKLDPFLYTFSHPAVFVSSGCVMSFVPAACVRPAASLNSTHYRTPWHPVPWERIERLREDKPSIDFQILRPKTPHPVEGTQTAAPAHGGRPAYGVQALLVSQ